LATCLVKYAVATHAEFSEYYVSKDGWFVMVGGLNLAPSSRTPATEPAIRCSRMDGVARATDPLLRHSGIMAADMLYVYVE
jgi:hypothetical protein